MPWSERLPFEGQVLMLIIRSIVVIVAAVLLTVGCSSKVKPHHHTHDPRHLAVDILSVQSEPVPISRQMAQQEGIVRVSITPHGFSPALLTYKMGDKVKLHLVNESGRPHNLIIPRFGIATSVIAPTAQNYIEFTASAKGSWPFFSDAMREVGDPVPGFVGTLKVE